MAENLTDGYGGLGPCVDCGATGPHHCPAACDIPNCSDCASQEIGAGPVPQPENGDEGWAPAEPEPQALPAAEAFAVAAEQLAEPTLVEKVGEGLPFPTPTFNEADCWREVAAKNREVANLHAVWEDLKNEASTAKKAYERAQEQLTNLIARIDRERRDAERQPMLREVVEDTPKPTGCSYERASGLPCPICRRASVPPSGADSEEHAVAAANEPAFVEDEQAIQAEADARNAAGELATAELPDAPPSEGDES